MQLHTIQILFLYAVASLIGSLSYCLCWIIQKKTDSFIVLNISISVAGAILFLFSPSVFFLLLPALLSSFVRCRIEKDNKNSSEYFWTVLVATGISCFVSSIVFNEILFPKESDEFVTTAIIIPSLTPILFQAWESLTLRPGMDKHFDE